MTQKRAPLSILLSIKLFFLVTQFRNYQDSQSYDYFWPPYFHFSRVYLDCLLILGLFVLKRSEPRIYSEIWFSQLNNPAYVATQNRSLGLTSIKLAIEIWSSLGLTLSLVKPQTVCFAVLRGFLVDYERILQLLMAIPLTFKVKRLEPWTSLLESTWLSQRSFQRALPVWKLVCNLPWPRKHLKDPTKSGRRCMRFPSIAHFVRWPVATTDVPYSSVVNCNLYAF